MALLLNFLMETVTFKSGLLNLFLDSSGFTGQATQVIKFGTSNVATSFHFDTCNQRAVCLEHALNTFTVRHFSNGK